MYSVYKHTNKINGKIYIGITSQKVEDRWKNGTHYEHNQHFTNAINHYGWDNFIHEILHTNLTEKEAKEKEKYYIALYNTMDPNFGYNLTPGGEGYILNKEQKEKLRQSIIKTKNSPEFIEKKKKIYTNEWRQKVKEKTIEAMNSATIKQKMRAIYDSEEWRNNNSENTKKQWATSNLKSSVRKSNGKKVYCKELNKIYDCLIDATRELGIERHQITCCCQGKKEKDNKFGYHWEYIK